MAAKYPDKIRYYEYLPWLYCGALSKREYDNAKELPNDSIHLLSNYYNYALSKTTYKYVMKIDADQIYFADELTQICDLYRKRRISIPTFKELLSFIKCLYKFKIHDGVIDVNTILLYQKCLKKFIRMFKFQISLSGINLCCGEDSRWLIPLGKISDGVSILPPYNGVGDHIIFKVTKNTFFIPYDCVDYATVTGANFVYIEKLVGYGRSFPYGIVWWHLNACRKNIYKRQIKNVENYPDRYLDIDSFLKSDANNLMNTIESIMPSKIISYLVSLFQIIKLKESLFANLKQSSYNPITGFKWQLYGKERKASDN